MLIHQSDLKSHARCGEQHRRQLNGEQGKQLSATAYGSVAHHALHVLERTRDVDLAVNTFDHFWHPLNIDEICTPVEEWIGRQSYGVLRTKGMAMIRRYWEHLQYQDEELLALEFPFVVPIPGTRDEETGQPHELAGTIDRLSLRFYRRQLHVCVDDWKTGKKPSFLQHQLQFTAYCFATTQPEFWVGSAEHLTEGFGPERGAQLHNRLRETPRHGWWIDVSAGPTWSDAGLRAERDYKRFRHAVDTYVRARQHHIFPLNIDGSVCEFCPFRDDCPEGIDQ